MFAFLFYIYINYTFFIEYNFPYVYSNPFLQVGNFEATILLRKWRDRIELHVASFMMIYECRPQDHYSVLV